MCINVSGLGWTGSSLLVEIFKKSRLGVYHNEFNFLRHPRLDGETHNVTQKDKVFVLFSEILSCIYNVRQDVQHKIKLKIVIEIHMLLMLLLISLFIDANKLKKIYLYGIYKIYSQRGILVLDQMYFPEDLSEAPAFELFSTKHIYILRKNTTRIMRERKKASIALTSKTVQEKFLMGKKLDCSDQIIFGDVAREILREREVILRNLEADQEVCIIYFEDLIEDTENTLEKLEAFVGLNLFIENKENTLMFVEKSRANL